MIDKIFYIFTLLILLLFKPDRLDEFSVLTNLIFSITFFFLLTFFLVQQRKNNKNWLRLDVIFLIGFGFAHFQIPFLASIGIEPEVPNLIWPNKQVVNFATWMSLFSINLWMLGYSFIKIKKYNNIPNIEKPNISFLLYDSILLISFIFFLLTVGPSLYRGEYGGSEIWGEGAVYPFLILRTMLNLRIIYFIMQFKENLKFKNLIKNLLKNKIFFIVLFLYISLFLLSGKRGSIMQVALVAAGAYVIFIKPISLTKLIMFLIAGAFLFTILALGRGVGNETIDNGNIFTRGYSAYQEDEGKGITGNLSSTVRIQYRALNVVPSTHPYLYGITFLTGIVGIIPFAGGLIVNTFDVPKMYQGTSNFFTIISQGPNPTSGDGSEILADIYVNFGVYGVFIIMFFFGLTSSFIYKKALSNNLIFIIIYLVLIYAALTINRGSILSPVKDIAYILFFHFVFNKPKKSKNRFQLSHNSRLSKKEEI